MTEVERRAAAARVVDYWSRQELAAILSLQDDGRFCAFGGLNPHLPGPGGDLAACRTCGHECRHGWRASAL